MHVGGRYRVVKQIGSGSFGTIYLGVSEHSGLNVAIKFERLDARYPQLSYEARVYRALQGGEGIPNVRWFGTEGEHSIMVTDLLGPSLEDLFNCCKRRFSLKTVILLADQLLSRIEYVHHCGFVHRDIKPDNFLMGHNRHDMVPTADQTAYVHDPTCPACSLEASDPRLHLFAIDFGLSKKFRDPRTKAHIPYREGKSLTGTARYASVNTHFGKEQSRRDDLESLGYMLVYFLLGCLPWQGLKEPAPVPGQPAPVDGGEAWDGSKRKTEMIRDLKASTPPETLCRTLPSEFVDYFRYVASLRFDARPDYAYLRGLFASVAIKRGYAYDSRFDWTLVPAAAAAYDARAR